MKECDYAHFTQMLLNFGSLCEAEGKLDVCALETLIEKLCDITDEKIVNKNKIKEMISEYGMICTQNKEALDSYRQFDAERDHYFRICDAISELNTDVYM